LKNIEIYTSLYPGFGKSFAIRSKAYQNNLNHKYLPLHRLDNIVSSLKSLNISTNDLLHIDITCDDYHDFLLELIFFNKIINHETGEYFILDPNVVMAIELHNSIDCIQLINNKNIRLEKNVFCVD